MTRDRAMAIFHDFFRFGDAMDPDAPDSIKGYKRAAGGVVYAPAKGLLYGGRTVLTGVLMGTASVVAGAGAMVGNIAMGVKEMGEAGINATKTTTGNKESSNCNSILSEESQQVPILDEDETEVPSPSFLGGLKRATIGAVAAPVAVRSRHPM